MGSWVCLGCGALIGLACLEVESQVFREEGPELRSLSCRLLRRKGLLLKKVLRFFWTCVSCADPRGAAPLLGLVGDCLALVGSWLDTDVGLDTSLCESRLDGLYTLFVPELRSEEGPFRQNIVIPSVGYALWGTADISPC